MARLSVKVQERKRQKLVAKYAAKRAELKAKGDYEALDKLPKNASPVRLHNRCKATGRPKGYICENLGFQESPSESGHQKEKFQVLPKPVGSICSQKNVTLQDHIFAKETKT